MTQLPSGDREMLEAVARWAYEALGDAAFASLLDDWTLGKPVVGVFKEERAGKKVYASNLGDCWLPEEVPGGEKVRLLALPCPPGAGPAPFWSVSATPLEEAGETWDTVRPNPRGRRRGSRRAWARR